MLEGDFRLGSKQIAIELDQIASRAKAPQEVGQAREHIVRRLLLRYLLSLWG